MHTYALRIHCLLWQHFHKHQLKHSPLYAQIKRSFLLYHILPKGTSFENLTDADMVLLRNHINSSARASLFGKSPTEVAMNVLPYILFECIDIKLLPAEEINLTPTLLKQNKAD